MSNFQIMPLVSVIIPTYNCAKYLPEAIDSVLNQTYRNFEIIVVDDGSTDNTKEIVETYIQKYPTKIRYFYQTNEGLPGARNTGIKVAKGDYIALLDDDDEYFPNSLEICINFSNRYDADWYIADILCIEDAKKEIRLSNIPKGDSLINVLEEYFIKIAFFYNKKVLFEIGLYDECFGILEDCDLNIRMIEANKKFAYINEPLYIYKVRKKSLVRNNIERTLFFILKLLKKHHKRLADAGNKKIAKIYSKHMWNLARRYFYEIKDIKKCIHCITESIKYDFNLDRFVHPLFFNVGKWVKR